ncbi:thiamine-phosphate kinase [Terriglobus roseus]|uniref:thiamine-phosphate kinase n=1 Tax=Terriglobus roseus TaxID=392734 RepID=UPI0009F55E1D|nr:thiamine-phosphate kinase [Terriglobus roseus]
MANTGELALIQHIRQRAARRGGTVRLGIGDDCAVLRPPAGQDLLITTDFSLEGRHFRRDWHSANSAGHRCLARGLSDLAAMGAKPMAAFLSLALPAGLTRNAAGRRWVDDFFAGLMKLADATGTPLAGGDTATAPGDAVLADIVLLGSAPRGSEMRRSGANAGDALYVTGSLGGSSAELAALCATPNRFRRAIADGSHPHLFPAPRLVAGQRLRHVATAAIDLSDGLSTDLHHLCDESGVGAIVDAALLPIHPLALKSASPLGAALNGGEDYELLFTAPAASRMPKLIGGVAITRIGQMTRDSKILLIHEGKNKPLPAGGWEHRI